jgi:hypothetical protein
MAALSRAVDTDAATSWPVALGEFSVRGYRAVALAGEPEMRAEWEAMRNCTLDHVAACRQGTQLALSLRDRDTGERIATVILKRQRGCYALLDARRRFNRPVDAELWAAAGRAAAIYSGACAARPVRRASACRHGGRGERPFAGDRLAGSQRALDF